MRGKPRFASPILTGAGSVGRVMAFEGSARLLAMLALIILARRLGPSQYGLLILATTVFSFAALLADAGISHAGVQRFTSTPRGREQFRSFASARLTLAVCFSAAALVAGFVSSSSAVRMTAILLIGLVPYMVLNNVAVNYRIIERFGTGASASALAVLLLSLGPMLVALARPDLSWAIYGGPTSLAVAALVWASRDKAARAWPKWRSVRQALAAGFPFLTTSIAVAAYSRGDRLVLGAMAPSAEVGYYGAAYSFVWGISLLSTAIQTVNLPRVLRHVRDGRQSLDAYKWHQVRLSWLLSLPLAATFFVWGDDAIRLLYTASFRPAEPIARVLALIIPLYFVNPCLATHLIARGRQKHLARVSVINVGIASVAYPVGVFFMGAVGAAVASVVIETAGHVMQLAYCRGAALPVPGSLDPSTPTHSIEARA